MTATKRYELINRGERTSTHLLDAPAAEVAEVCLPLLAQPNRVAGGDVRTQRARDHG